MLVYRKKTISAPNKIQSLSLTIGRSDQFSRCVFYTNSYLYSLVLQLLSHFGSSCAWCARLGVSVSITTSSR